MSAIRLTAALLLCCTLAACGGGSGGGGNNNGGGDGLSVSPTSLSFSFSNGVVAPVTKQVNVKVTNSAAAQVGAAYAPGVTPAPWLNIGVSSSVLPDVVFDFTAAPAGLPPGTYQTTVSVGFADSSGNILAHRDVAVSMTIAVDLDVSSDALTFNYAIGGPPPDAQGVTVSGNGAIDWTASTDQPWVTLSATSGTTPSLPNLGVDPTGLAAGHYTATVTFTSPGQTHTLGVDLTVAAPMVQPTETLLTFTGINGATLFPQSLGITLNNIAPAPFTATSNAPWLILSRTSGVSPGVIEVSVDPANGLLASGSHNAKIAIDISYAGTLLHADVSVTLNLTPATLTVSPAAIELGGADGADTNGAAVELSLNTNEHAFPWSVSGLATGAQSTALSGSVSAVPVTLGMHPSTTVDGNTYTSTATFSATVNGDTVTRQVPMTVRIKPHRLFVHDSGIALLSTPTLQSLTADVTVRENRNLPATWTAVSDQPWLTLTNAGGSTPADFHMTANPSSLPVGAISFANVTVTSSSPGVTNTEIVRVGLYKTNVAPPGQSTASVVASTTNGIAADPVRPYVYISHGTTTVDVYNIYTGALVRTHTTSAGSQLGSLAIDDNGSRLYAADHTTKSIRVFDIDAGTPAAIANWTDPRWVVNCCAGDFAFVDLDYTRVNGRGVLIGGGMEIIDAASGESLTTAPFSFFAANLVGSVSGDGTTSFWASMGTSGHTVSRKTQSFDELADAVTFGDPPLFLSHDGVGRGLSTDYTGAVVFRACWYAASQIERYDGLTLGTTSIVTSGTNGGAILGPDGLVYCARYYNEPVPSVWAVDGSTGAVIAGHEYNVLEPVMERQFVLSGDGLRLLTRSQDLSPLATSGTLSSTTIAP
jgi:hypothetical protein